LIDNKTITRLCKPSLITVFLSIFLCSCAIQNKNIPLFESYKNIRGQQIAVNTCKRTTGKIFINHNGLNFSTRFRLIFRYPDHLRLELYPQGGFPVHMITTHKGEGIFVDILNRSFWQGDTNKVFKKILPKGLHMDHLLALILGTIPFDSPPDIAAQNEGIWLTWKKGWNQFKVELCPTSYKPLILLKTSHKHEKWNIDISYNNLSPYPDKITAYLNSTSENVFTMEELITETWEPCKNEIFNITLPNNFKRKKNIWDN